MKSLKLKLKIKKRLLFLSLVLAAEIVVLGFLSAGFPVMSVSERVFVAADGEFLFQTLKSTNFVAFFGDRADPSRLRLRLERAGAVLELSLKGDPLENVAQDPVLAEDLAGQDRVLEAATPSARLLRLQAEAEARLTQERQQISSEAGQLLGQIEAQVEDISQSLGTISAGLESIQTQSAQIEAQVEEIFGPASIVIEEGQETIKTSTVLPGVDVSQQLVGSGVRQKIILKNPPQESNFRFSLTLEGLRANQDQNGHWQFLNSSGRPLLFLAPPVAEDAAGQQGAVTLEISPEPLLDNSSPTTYHLSLSLNSSWLASPNRVFPVTIRQDILAIILGLTPAKETFTAAEEAVFEFEYWPDEGEIKMEAIRAYLAGYGGETVLAPEIEKIQEGKLTIRLPRPIKFRAGKYRMRLEYEQRGVTKTASQDFSWGVLAINVDKSIYLSSEALAKEGLPPEQAYLQMAVLDDGGRTVCDAALTLQILNPKFQILNLSTQDGSIQKSPECGPNTVTYTPDYSAYYQVDGPGIYQMELTAATANGEHSIQDQFEVKESVPFEVSRQGPTRIYPLAPYTMTLTVKANQDFEGEIKELVPAGFSITGQEGMAQSSEGSTKVLTWEVNLSSGQTRELSYEFDAPDQSPQFYLLGPLTLITLHPSPITVFSESRRWQIASDSPAMPTVQSVTGQTAGAVNQVVVNSVPGGTNQLYIAIGHFYTSSPAVGNNVISSFNNAGGLTWALVTGTRGCSDRITAPRVEWWWAFGSPSTFNATVDLAGTTGLAGAHIAIVRIDGAANEMPINGEYANTAGDNATCDTTGTDNASPTIGLTISNSNSLALNSAFPRNQGDGVSTPDANYTQDYEVTNISGGNASTIWAGHRTTSPAVGTETITHSLGGTRPWVMVAAEIKEAPSGPTNEQLMWHGKFFSGGAEQPMEK